MSLVSSFSPSVPPARDLGRAAESLGRSLGRLSAEANPAASGLAPAAARFNGQTASVKGAAAGVQQAVSRLQAADQQLGAFGAMVDRLRGLAGQANAGGNNRFDLARVQRDFTALQAQVRQAVGGATAEIGGTRDVAADPGQFAGRDLFGGETGPTVVLDSAGNATLTLPTVNLRAGAMGALIAQDAAGSFRLNAADPAASEILARAGGELTGDRAALGPVRDRLERASALLQIEGENLASAMPPLTDPPAVAAATQFVRFEILAQPGIVAAVGNGSVGGALKVLQG